MKKKTGAFQVYLRFIASVYRNNKLFVLSKVFISVLAGLLSVVTAVLPKYMADAILIDNSEYGFIAYVLLYVPAQRIIGAVYNFVEIYINKSLIVVKAKCTEEVLERLYRMVYANYEQPERRSCIGRAFRSATQTGTIFLPASARSPDRDEKRRVCGVFYVAPPRWTAQTAGIRPPSARDSNLQNRPVCLTTGTETRPPARNFGRRLLHYTTSR